MSIDVPLLGNKLLYILPSEFLIQRTRQFFRAALSKIRGNVDCGVQKCSYIAQPQALPSCQEAGQSRETSRRNPQQRDNQCFEKS